MNSKKALNGKKVPASKQSVEISSSEGSYLNPLDQIHEDRAILPLLKVQKQQHSLDTKCNVTKRTKNRQEQSSPCKKLYHDKKTTLNNHYDSKSTECMNELETVPAF